MNTKICNYCGKEKGLRGFAVHEKACMEKHIPEENPLRERYANQIRTMTPEQAERFLRKAAGV